MTHRRGDGDLRALSRVRLTELHDAVQTQFRDEIAECEAQTLAIECVGCIDPADRGPVRNGNLQSQDHAVRIKIAYGVGISLPQHHRCGDLTYLRRNARSERRAARQRRAPRRSGPRVLHRPGTAEHFLQSPMRVVGPDVCGKIARIPHQVVACIGPIEIPHRIRGDGRAQPGVAEECRPAVAGDRRQVGTRMNRTRLDRWVEHEHRATDTHLHPHVAESEVRRGATGRGRNAPPTAQDWNASVGQPVRERTQVCRLHAHPAGSDRRRKRDVAANDVRRESRGAKQIAKQQCLIEGRPGAIQQRALRSLVHTPLGIKRDVVPDVLKDQVRIVLQRACEIGNRFRYSGQPGTFPGRDVGAPDFRTRFGRCWRIDWRRSAPRAHRRVGLLWRDRGATPRVPARTLNRRLVPTARLRAGQRRCRFRPVEAVVGVLPGRRLQRRPQEQNAEKRWKKQLPS